MKGALKWILLIGGGYLVATRTNLLCMVGVGASCGTAAGAPPTGGPQPGATPGVVTAPVAAAPPAAPTAGGYNTLAGILGRLQATLASNGVAQSQGNYVATPWQFNYFLNQVAGIDLSQGGALAQIFKGCGTGGACDTTPITLPQFWSAVAPWLQTNQGLSGLGAARLAALAAHLRGTGCQFVGEGRYSCFPTEYPYSLATANQTSSGGNN